MSAASPISFTFSDAQRQEFVIEDQAAVAQEAVVIQYVALYKALGGGWELYDDARPFALG